MKAQTFEEVLRSVGIEPECKAREVMDVYGVIYRAAMRNAARIADSHYNGFHSPYEYSANVADAIRDAARGG